MGQMWGLSKSNKDRTDQGKKLKLCFPVVAELFGQVSRFYVTEFDWSEPSTCPFNFVLAIDLTEQLVASLCQDMV